MCDNELELSVCMRDYASAQENTERRKKWRQREERFENVVEVDRVRKQGRKDSSDL